MFSGLLCRPLSCFQGIFWEWSILERPFFNQVKPRVLRINTFCCSPLHHRKTQRSFRRENKVSSPSLIFLPVPLCYRHWLWAVFFLQFISYQCLTDSYHLKSGLMLSWYTALCLKIYPCFFFFFNISFIIPWKTKQNSGYKTLTEKNNNTQCIIMGDWDQPYSYNFTRIKTSVLGPLIWIVGKEGCQVVSIRKSTDCTSSENAWLTADFII